MFNQNKPKNTHRQPICDSDPSWPETSTFSIRPSRNCWAPWRSGPSRAMNDNTWKEMAGEKVDKKKLDGGVAKENKRRNCYSSERRTWENLLDVLRREWCRDTQFPHSRIEHRIDMLGRHRVHISGSPKRRNKKNIWVSGQTSAGFKANGSFGESTRIRVEFIFKCWESWNSADCAKKLDNTFVSMNRDKKKSDVIWFARLRLSSTRNFDLLHEVDSFKNNALAYVKMTDNDPVASNDPLGWKKTMNLLGRRKITERLTNCSTKLATKWWTSRLCYWHS